MAAPTAGFQPPATRAHKVSRSATRYNPTTPTRLNTMRLTPRDREIIRNTTREVFGPGASVRLFGSRTHDSLRGGDIDLLVELARPQSDARRKALTLVARLQMRLGDQPIDVLVIDPGTAQSPIQRQAAATGLPI